MFWNDETELLITTEILESAFLGNPPTKTEAEIRGYARAIAEFVNNPSEVAWLFSRIRGGCTFFPKPIEARRIHNRAFNAADKLPLEKADMGDTVKGIE